ncbi:MAG TPA: CmcI family methyltransferase [Hyphomicrobiales bacterium]|nr:CmcI family methyltransferase [Hyphomicrobiales bacterium]
MKACFDLDAATATVDGRTVALDSPEAFEALVKTWVVAGWRAKYSYRFTWMGRPIIQLPEDMIRIQELIWRIKPDVLVETGIAHGGSLIFYASLFEAMGKGRVVGVDVEIRPHNRAAIEAHDLKPRITLIEGSSTDPAIVRQVREQIRPGETVMVVLDSNHTKAHVLAELRAYAPLVTRGSFIVATDGIMAAVADAPRGQPGWREDNPAEAARTFLSEDRRFALAMPLPGFDESEVTVEPTYWPDAYLQRVAE